MFSSILILFILPLLGKFKVKSSKFLPIMQIFYWFFVVDVFILGILGACVVEQPYVILSQIAAIFYFSYFLLIIPFLEYIETNVMNCHPDLFWNVEYLYWPTPFTFKYFNVKPNRFPYIFF